MEARRNENNNTRPSLYFFNDKLTPECEHGLNISETFVRRIAVFQDISVNKTRCVCHNCFISEKRRLDIEKRSSKPLENNLKCLLCDREPSRYKTEWENGCCDKCFAENKKLEENHAAVHEIKSSVLPDCLIEKQLYIGPKESAANRDCLINLGISRVLVCCHSIPFYLEKDPSIHYLRLYLDDSLDQHILDLIPYAFAFIDEGIRNNEATLVHCNSGVSRSGAICVAWLMKTFNLNCDDALMNAKLKRDKITPNSNFIEQLNQLKFE